MQQRLEESVLPTHTLPGQNLPVEEQLEIQKPQSRFRPGKRLNGKRKDTFRRGQVLLLKTGAYGSIGLALFSIGLVSLFLLLMVGIEISQHFHPTLDFKREVSLGQYALNVGMLLSPFLIGAGIFGGVGLRARKWANHLDANLPVQNAGDLPASESLLRGSTGPVQEQQAVLLRAAGQGPETVSHHLLRAAGESAE